MKMDPRPQQDVQVVSTGSLGLDVALGVGGLPRGRDGRVYGPSPRKTTLPLSVIAQAQKMAAPRAFIDAEKRARSAVRREVGVQDRGTADFPARHREQALRSPTCWLRSGSVDVIVIDSVAALTPKAEIEGEMASRRWVCRRG